MRKGYQSVINESVNIKRLAGDLRAHEDISRELLRSVEKFATGVRVTATELKRDFGFTATGLRLLEKNRQLVPVAVSGERRTYDLAKALKVRVLQLGIAKLGRVRTTRKHSNIVTIYREFLNKVGDSIL